MNYHWPSAWTNCTTSFGSDTAASCHSGNGLICHPDQERVGFHGWPGRWVLFMEYHLGCLLLSRLRLFHLSSLLVMRRQEARKCSAVRTTINSVWLCSSAVHSILARFDEISARHFVIFADILYAMTRMNHQCHVGDVLYKFWWMYWFKPPMHKRNRVPVQFCIEFETVEI